MQPAEATAKRLARLREFAGATETLLTKRVVLTVTVCKNSKTKRQQVRCLYLLLFFCESAFWKGCGGTLFREKGSPAIILKITLR